MLEAALEELAELAALAAAILALLIWEAQELVEETSAPLDTEARDLPLRTDPQPRQEDLIKRVIRPVREGRRSVESTREHEKRRTD